MELSIKEAVIKSGLSERQLTYGIKTGKIKAHKVNGKWRVDDTALPSSDGRAAAQERKAQQEAENRRAAIGTEKALGPANTTGKFFTMTTLKAFQNALSICRDAFVSLPDDHGSLAHLRQSLHRLAEGCHRFFKEDKKESYRAARDAASLATCELYLDGGETANALALRLEEHVIPIITALLGRLDKRLRI